jgi:predicted esterase
VACGQSSQPTAPGLGCWDDPGLADADFEAFLRAAAPRRPEPIAVAGFSQGASVAVRAALRGLAPLGFVALAAAFSPRDLRGLVEQAPGAPRVRGILWLGDRDPWLAAAREAWETLRGAGHDVGLEITAGRGHSLSWEMTAMVPELLRRWRDAPAAAAPRS